MAINLEQLQKAFDRFLYAYDIYQADTTDELIKEALVHRFEYCTEVFWKLLKKHLESEGIFGLNSPKTIIRQASISKILDGEIWIEFINVRQLIAHDYDEEKLEKALTYMNTFAEHGRKLLSYLEANNED